MTGVQQPRQRPLRGTPRVLYQGGVPGETPLSASSSGQDLGPLSRDGNTQVQIFLRLQAWGAVLLILALQCGAMPGLGASLA